MSAAPPALHSMAGAPAAIFLDFDGDVTTHIQPFSLDGDPFDFNPAEHEAILDIWQNVAAHFAMFDIDVTTEMPIVPFAWHAVGNNVSGFSGSTGVFPATQPGSVSNSTIARTRPTAISHVLGYNFGLENQSDYSGGVKIAELALSDEGVGRLMGLDNSGNVHAWWIGHPSSSMAGLQNDAAVIASKIAAVSPPGRDGYRLDDFAASPAQATPLTPDGSSLIADGIVERFSDIDMFSFTSTGGVYVAEIVRPTGSTVDVSVEVIDAAGKVVSWLFTGAEAPSLLHVDTVPGVYHVRVASKDGPGSLGLYRLRLTPSLPSGWGARDQGGSAITKGHVLGTGITGELRVTAAGIGLGGTSNSDRFHFDYRPLTGDGEIVARVHSVSAGLAGVMMREVGNVNPSRVWFNRNSSSKVGGTSGPTVTGPVYLKLARVGNTFTSSYSEDGVNWTVHSTTNVSMDKSILVGLATSSGTNDVLTSVLYDSLNVTGSAAGFTRPLAAPANLTAIWGDTIPDYIDTASLDWANVTGATSYDVEESSDGMNFTRVATTSAGSNSQYSDTSNVANLWTYYRVRAADGTVNEWGPASGVVSLRGRPASQLTALPVSEDAIQLDWLDATGETGYRLYRSAAGGGSGFTLLGTLAPGFTTFTNSGLAANTRYDYYVQVDASDGTSTKSTTLSPITRLAAPTGLRFTSQQNTSFSIAWTDMAGETGYRVLRSTNGGPFTIIGSTAANAVTFTDSNVSPLTKYYYAVAGYHASGDGTPANAIMTSTPADQPLPAPWLSQDVGSTFGRGAAGFDGGVFTTIASGQTIRGVTDSLRYVYQPISGSTQITARVLDMDNFATTGDVGLMIRESLTTNARAASIILSPEDGAVFLSRATAGALATESFGPAPSLEPYWVRLTRVDDLFIGEVSADAITWTRVGSAAISMASSALVGFGGSASSNDFLQTTRFDQVAISAPSILFSVDDVTQNESDTGTVYVFNVSINQAPTTDVSVEVSTSDGTAFAGLGDYISKSQRLTFSPGGSLSQQFIVEVPGDQSLEPNETFFVNLNQSIGGVVLDERGTGTLVNDDLGLTINDMTLAEGDSGIAQLIYTVSLNLLPSAPLAVPFTTVDGSALAGRDFNTASGTLMFDPAGPLSLQIIVDVPGDTVVEPTRAFSLKLTPRAHVGGDHEGSGVIVNDDAPPNLILALATGTIDEFGGTIAATVTRTGALDAELVVLLASSDTTEATVPASVVIPAGQASAAFVVTAQGDALIDGTQRVAITASVQAADESPVVLDLPFGIGGMAVTQLVATSNFPQSIAIQADGKIVLGGNDSNSARWRLMRLNADGTPDTTFGTNGIVVTSFTTNNPVVNKIIIQPDGKILAGGKLAAGAGTSALTRYTPDGTLDPSFGVNGIANLASISGWIEDMDLAANGSLMLAIRFNGTVFFRAARVSSAGALTHVYTFNTVNATATEIELLDDGRFLLAGDEFVLRSDANGTLDGTFGVEGVRDLSVLNSTIDIADIALDANGRIVLGGTTLTGGLGNFALARLGEDGTIDTSFGAGGLVTTDFADDRGKALVLQPDGKMILAGYADLGPINEAAIARYLDNGSLDPAFGVDGRIQQAIGSNVFQQVFAAEFHSEGKLLVLGGGHSANQPDFRVAQYHVAMRAAAAIDVTDSVPPPTISINDIALLEGDSGNVAATFMLTLSQASEQAISVTVNTVNGSATGPDDFFAATNQVVTFSPGMLTQPVTVTVKGDTHFELDQEFSVVLSNPVHVIIADDTGLATLLNDDSRPVLTVSNDSTEEGTFFNFSITLSNKSDETITVHLSNQSGTATIGGPTPVGAADVDDIIDFVLTISPRAGSSGLGFAAWDDLKDEPNETFTFTLSNATNATIGTGVAIGTVIDNDALPTIDFLRAGRDPLPLGDDLTLRAYGPEDDGGIDEVQFYHDTDDNGVLNAATDAYLGRDFTVLGNWTLVVPTATFTGGTHRFFARAVDEGGDLSSAVSDTVFIDPLDPPGNDRPNAGNDQYTVMQDQTLLLTPTPVTRIRIISDPNDGIGSGLGYDYLPPTDTFGVSKSNDNGVRIRINPDDAHSDWDMSFANIDHALLTSGYYPNATRDAFQQDGTPGMGVSGNNFGHNELTGQFVVHELVWNATQTQVLGFAAQFEQHGISEQGAINPSGTFGWIQYNTAIGAGAGLLANDADLDHDFLFAELVTPPAHGTLSLNRDGSFSYTPNPGFAGIDTFTYRTSDGRLQSDPATATITVDALPDLIAPFITGVYVGGTQWTADYTDYLALIAGGGPAGFALPSGPGQLSALPWVNIDRLTIKFSENVDAQAADMLLLGVNVPDYATQLAAGNFSYDSATFSATWTMGAWLGADKLRIVISDRLSDEAGNALDGEWTDAVSAQSGDGAAGGDFSARFNVLPGDANDSGSVAGDDVIRVRNAQFLVPGTPGYDPRFDINSSGSIFGNDVILVRNRQFTRLPDGEPLLELQSITASFANETVLSLAGPSGDSDAAAPLGQHVILAYGLALAPRSTITEFNKPMSAPLSRDHISGHWTVPVFVGQVTTMTIHPPHLARPPDLKRRHGIDTQLPTMRNRPASFLGGDAHHVGRGHR